MDVALGSKAQHQVLVTKGGDISIAPGASSRHDSPKEPGTRTSSECFTQQLHGKTEFQIGPVSSACAHTSDSSSWEGREGGYNGSPSYTGLIFKNVAR